jgi:hypothetical protein
MTVLDTTGADLALNRAFVTAPPFRARVAPPPRSIPSQPELES